VLVVHRPATHRARPVGAPRGSRSIDTTPSERLLEVAVRSLRRGEDGESDGAGASAATVNQSPARPLPTRTSPTKTLSILRGAVSDGAAVRLGYASSDGATVEYLLDPVNVTGGQLVAYDHTGGDIRTFAVSRVTGVEVLTDRSTGQITPDADQPQESA
jgi:predicted DNA-binding transcriptional regulator YafY